MKTGDRPLPEFLWFPGFSRDRAGRTAEFSATSQPLKGQKIPDGRRFDKMFILLGGGSAKAVVEVQEIPKVGDEITVSYQQIKQATTPNAFLMVGRPVTITGFDGNVEIDGEQMPSFSYTA